MISLTNYGWNSFFQAVPIINDKQELITARVISIQGFKYYVITESGEREAELSGRLLYALSSDELPKLGDWVRMMDYEQTGYIVEVFPRQNELSRKEPGSRTQKQLLAVNLDAALIVQGLDQNFNLMRLERYLVQLAACQIKAIVILNKCDLIEDQVKFTEEIAKLQRDCAVYFCSTYSGTGIEVLKHIVLEPHKTYVLIGSSGVGKSSLLNSLMETSVQKVNTTSDANHKGKHTTTTRDLFQLPNGALIIDTPGMREFGLTSDADGGGDDLFPAIQEVAINCRFSDCRHINEVGCGVLAALDSGKLSRDVYDSYLKLIKEQRRFEVNAEDRKRINKQSGRVSREAQKHRKRYKG